MARIAEPEKIENIKKAVMQALVEHGYGGMSIATISEIAGVSPGYLYRFYESKEELVREVVKSEMGKIFDNFRADLDSSKTVYEAGYKSIYNLLMIANKDSILARFMASIVMDVNAPTNASEDNFKELSKLAGKAIELGLKSGELNKGISPMDVIIVSFTLPFRYISILLKIDPDKKFTEDEARKITKICMNALK